MNSFAIHAHLGLTLARAKEIEDYVISTIKSTKSIPRTTTCILKATNIKSRKSLSKPERDYLLLCLGIYIRHNQEIHEHEVLHSPGQEPEENDEY